MEIVKLPLPGLKLLRPSVFKDERGFFVETWSESRLRQLGFLVEFVQDNHSRSTKNTVRGLHFQRASADGPGQAKLVRCAGGSIFDVAVDVRPWSKTFGKWHGVTLDAEKHEQLFIPTGFAHGFCVLSDVADVMYKCSAPYNATTEAGFFWNDPDVGISWPIDQKSALLSARDQGAKCLKDIHEWLT